MEALPKGLSSADLFERLRADAIALPAVEVEVPPLPVIDGEAA